MSNRVLMSVKKEFRDAAMSVKKETKVSMTKITEEILRDTDNLRRVKERLKRRGAISDIFLIIIAATIVTLIGMVIFIASNRAADTFSQIGSFQIGPNNVSNLSGQSIEKGNEAISYSSIYVPWTIIIGLIFLFFIAAYTTEGNPIFYTIYFIVAIIGIIAAWMVSDAYTQLTSVGLLQEAKGSFRMHNFFIEHMAITTSIISAIGAILLFVRPRKSQQQGGVIA